MASDRLRRNSKEKTVILDSNAIMMLFEFSLELDDELTLLLGKHHIVVPASVKRELAFLSRHAKGKKKRNAAAALNLLEQWDVADDEKTDGDTAVVSLAQQLNGVVVTNDRELRIRLKNLELPVIFLRGKQRLCLE